MGREKKENILCPSWLKQPGQWMPLPGWWVGSPLTRRVWAKRNYCKTFGLWAKMTSGPLTAFSSNHFHHIPLFDGQFASLQKREFFLCHFLQNLNTVTVMTIFTSSSLSFIYKQPTKDWGCYNFFFFSFFLPAYGLH